MPPSTPDPRPSLQRFTLIELLVSMAIFSIIMIILATMLHTTFLLIRKRNQRAKLAQTEQVVGDLLRRDFRNMVASDEAGSEIYLDFSFDPANDPNNHCLSDTASAFVTNSGIGIGSGNFTPLTKVFYYLGTDYTLRRGVIFCTDSTAMFPDGLPEFWAKPNIIEPDDDDIVARNVAGFKVEAEWSIDVPLGKQETTLPEIVTITIKFKDEWDSDSNTDGTAAYRTFVTRIFINQRNQL